ncbi:hypothetical protein TSAR_010149 [Trichomalopsis sarcophagae]|uniref:Uncharacterized protein n=1 Tax=Trichomalopsis sarcophagae TaxID=543379 RepID=A0A232F8F0_9HYME|nr:hypothetical protein TSAR_010149 [Trichomalopsis sarcophagae]
MHLPAADPFHTYTTGEKTHLQSGLSANNARNNCDSQNWTRPATDHFRRPNEFPPDNFPRVSVQRALMCTASRRLPAKKKLAWKVIDQRNCKDIQYNSGIIG